MNDFFKNLFSDPDCSAPLSVNGKVHPKITFLKRTERKPNIFGMMTAISFLVEIFI